MLFVTSCLVALSNGVGILVRDPSLNSVGLAVTNVAVLILIGGIGFTVTRFDNLFSRLLLPVVFLVASGPASVNDTASFVGLWLFLLSMILVIKINPVPKIQAWLILACCFYYLPWLYQLVVMETGDPNKLDRLINYLIFLGFSIVMLYVLFEEEIRDLLRKNQSQDLALADQAATIARLEPLSVLGERVAHVTHSFKNNLSQIGTALYYLEQGNDPEKARQKIEQFAKAMNERIDNILMVSRAGADQTVEVFDAARVLSGLNQVYLTEPRFLQQAKVELDIAEATAVEAVRWDFLLMAENILKNALEALTTKGTYGTIRVTLKGRRLTLANDGGAMPLCKTCPHDSCLECPNYGRPGQTTKATGSGHGLAQVFATCRKYGWMLKIRTEGDWTLFEIGF